MHHIPSKLIESAIDLYDQAVAPRKSTNSGVALKQIAQCNGFVEVYSRSVNSTLSDHHEKACMMWNNSGLLLIYKTHGRGSGSIMSADIFFNVEFDQQAAAENMLYTAGMSGGMILAGEKHIILGHKGFSGATRVKDCICKIESSGGRLISSWIKDPGWIVYMVTSSEYHKYGIASEAQNTHMAQIKKDIMESLPTDVLLAINPEVRETCWNRATLRRT